MIRRAPHGTKEPSGKASNWLRSCAIHHYAFSHMTLIQCTYSMKTYRLVDDCEPVAPVGTTHGTRRTTEDGRPLGSDRSWTISPWCDQSPAHHSPERFRAETRPEIL